MDKVPAMRITQRGFGEGGEEISLLVTTLPLHRLKEYVSVDDWTPANKNGYQRPPVERRLREVAKYVEEEEGILPTSILLATRPGDEYHLQFESTSGVDGFAEWGMLTIPDGVTLYLVDGQHRVFGVNRAYEKSGDPEFEKYPFPVTIMENVDRYREMVHFNIINTRQRKMPTDIVDRHLVLRQQKEGLDMIASGRRGEKAYFQATATRIVDELNEADSPWFHEIAIPGVPGRDNGMVRQHAVVASLDPVLKDNWVRAQQPMDEHLVRLLCNYWNALRDIWPDAFDDPKAYRVQATVGLYSLHMVLPAVIQRCLIDKDLSKDKIAELMGKTRLNSSFWSKDLSEGDPLVLGTGMGSIRALAQYIISQLPETPAASVRL